MLFEIHAERNAQDKKIFYYDNMTNVLKDADGTVFEYSNIPKQEFEPYKSFDRNTPLKKSKSLVILRLDSPKSLKVMEKNK